MEPQELAKNEESGGFSRRRISSILKAPRKSARFPDPEQQENVVECTRPVEKRNSRRVSFAPANDVLLFSKDVKNASPARSPLQELMTATGTAAATTQNRVQVAVTEDGTKQIMGMASLLNAPLHSSQQDKVTFDRGDGFGEKTVMFSTDEAFMDMTHSHTINIANDADISLHNEDVFSSGGEKTVMFTTGDASMDMTLSRSFNVSLPTGRNMDLSVEKRNVTSSVPRLDPGFEDFLASLSIPGGPSSLTATESNSSLAHIKTQKAVVDKENQIPPSVLATLNTSRRAMESSYGSVRCPEADVSMDMTEAQTGCILGFTSEDDPFQCLLPTQGMLAQYDPRVSQTTEMMKTKQQQSNEMLGFFEPKDVASSLRVSHPKHKVTSNAREECREKTIMFSADDEFMDMTQSHTVNITHGPLAPQQMSANGLDTGSKGFLSSLSRPSGHTVAKEMVPPTAGSFKAAINTNGSLSQLKTQRANVSTDKQSLTTSWNSGESSVGGATCPEYDMSMDMTETQTGRIIGVTGSDNPFQFLLPTQDMYPHNESLKKAEMTSGQKSSETLGSSSRIGTETSVKLSSKPKVQRPQDKFDTEDDNREKTVRFSADDACMDVTQSHTVNIATDIKLQLPQGLGFSPYKEKTVRFNANEAAMDMTECLTVNIDSNLASDSVFPVKKQGSEKCGPLRDRSSSALSLNQGFNNVCAGLSKPSDLSIDPVIARMTPKAATTDYVQFCPEDDISMDMTEAQTGKILEMSDTDYLHSHLPSHDMSYQHSNLRKAETTSHLQNTEVLGSTHCKGMDNSLKTSSLTKMQRHEIKFDSQDDCREKTVRFSADDAAMDVTQSHTVSIATHFIPQAHQTLDSLPACGEKTVRFTADNACMDVTRSHTVNIASHLRLQAHQNVDFLPTCGEKTVRFNANDAAMDVTRSHTVNIASISELKSHQSADLLPSCGEKTVRFNANDAAMDVTRSHTVNIASISELKSHQNADPLPPCGEKTVRFSANDAAMDVTRSHTVNIASASELKSYQNADPLPKCGEKTLRFNANDASMDVTRSHTVNIASNMGLELEQNLDFLPTCVEKTAPVSASDAGKDMRRSRTVNIARHLRPQPHQNVDFIPACGEKTARFNSNDGAMDMTQCLTVNIASNSEADSALPCPESNISSTHRNADLSLSVNRKERNTSSSVHNLDPGWKHSQSQMSDPWTNPVITDTVTPGATCPTESVNKNGYHDKLQMQKADTNTEKVAPAFFPDTAETPQYEAMTDCAENNVSMNMTEAQTGHILEQHCTEEVAQCHSSTQDTYTKSDQLKQTELSSEALGSSSPKGVETTDYPDSSESNEIANWRQPELQKMESPPSGICQDPDLLHSRKSRRISLADIQSKVRRLSHMINTAPDTVTIESCEVPLAQLDNDLDKNPKEETKAIPVEEPEPAAGLVNSQESTQAQCLTQEEEGEEASCATTTPFNLKTKQLMSRLSVGGFKPKLPQRSKPDETKKTSSVGEQTKTITVNITDQMSNFDNDVSDIYDEELGSYEDMSETLDTRSPQRVTEKASHTQATGMDEVLEDGESEQDHISGVHGRKRPLASDDSNMEDEKRMKTSTEKTTDFGEMELHSHLAECDGNMSTAPNMTTHATDCSSSSHTASVRCEATFESTLKHSLFESQLEDYASDVQKKLDDGTITVMEFFKLFNIDFVIHNPRQSVLPGRLLSDTDRTPMDLLKDRHISRPKQLVYETNVQNLTEKVEGLKVRMRDLDKPLKSVNGLLWEEMRNSSEKELKSFGAKLKERNSFFRKTGKAQSHEMKEDLYSNLVQANLVEQQKLRGTIEQADEMIKSLDDCISELEAELGAVEENGSQDKPSLKSRQDEMKKVTEALADSQRQISELERKQTLKTLKKVKAETSNLESHVAILHMLNEWKFAEKEDNCTAYTFLHDTMHLQLVYEKCKGKNADNQSERKISHINFKLQMDDEKSQCHARLVHKLLSQYIESETSWVEKYPTSRHVPKLLHDVGLVVGRCRLLGEELRLLKMWGGLRLDILNIRCVDTQVHIVFSSLKKCCKFEVVFSVGLINHLCVLQVESFKNFIGSSEITQIEEIVASFSPTKNLLTKIVKKIHDNLLR